MKQDLFIKGRGYEAFSTYEDGKVIVHVGSQLNYPKTCSFRKNTIAFAMREDPSIVKDGIVIKECEFDSPSTAAQFITGGSRNGYDTWKVRKGYSLGNYLQENDIRSRRIRHKEH